MTEFKREPRYIVFKIKDIDAYLPPGSRDVIAVLGNAIHEGRMGDSKAPFNAVVVEQDWPEFEPTWAAIEARMAGAPKKSYVPWENAGGPNECKHGYAEGIPCPRCDAEIAAWGIDTHSTPSPILTYEGCSVIQDAQAHWALNAIRQEPILREAIKSFLSTVLTVKRENLQEWMEYLAERINEVCEVIGEEDRFAYRPSREAILPVKK